MIRRRVTTALSAAFSARRSSTSFSNARRRARASASSRVTLAYAAPERTAYGSVSVVDDSFKPYTSAAYASSTLSNVSNADAFTALRDDMSDVSLG